MITKEQVLAALATVEEPDLKKDLVTLNMIRDIALGVNSITFTVVLTTPACPLKEVIKNRCLEAIHRDLGTDYDVTVNMTSDVTSTRQNQGPIMPGVKNIIAVASGKGGVGKSTITANLALALSKAGARVGLIDADISGPSVPTMFGIEGKQPQVTQIDGKNFMIPIERYGILLMSIGFLAPTDSAVVWRGPMMSSALRQFMTDTLWGELDYLLLDMPPGTSDIHLTLVQTVPVTGAVIVTTPQKVALADATKAVSMFQQEQINVPVLGVVENMAWFTPAELPNNKYYIFGKEGGVRMAERIGVPLLGQIPLIQSIRESGDDGVPSVLHQGDVVATSFEQLAENVARQVAIRNASEATKVVEVTI